MIAIASGAAGRGGLLYPGITTYIYERVSVRQSIIVVLFFLKESLFCSSIGGVVKSELLQMNIASEFFAFLAIEENKRCSLVKDKTWLLHLRTRKRTFLLQKT